jgi:hypothetical protein
VGGHHLAELENQLGRQLVLFTDALEQALGVGLGVSVQRGGVQQVALVCVASAAAPEADNPRQRRLTAGRWAQRAGDPVTELEQRLEPEHPPRPSGDARHPSAADEVM